MYHGTSAGTRAHQTVAYIGTVVGFHEEEKKWLVCDLHCLFLCVLFCALLVCICLSNRLSYCNKVRNSILSKRGEPNRVDEAFMSRYLPLTLTCQRSRYRLPHPRLAKYCNVTSSLINYITGIRSSTTRDRRSIYSTSCIYTIPVQVCPRDCSTG